MKRAQMLLLEALERERRAQLLLIEGKADEAALILREVADLYRRSWEMAPDRAFGRLAGMLKAAILGGEADPFAEFAREQVPLADSPASAWVLALAALVLGDDSAAASAAEEMRGSDGAFDRAADAVSALAGGDGSGYSQAVRAIVADFEDREHYLTGVAIADTALVLERLAEARGIAARPESSLLPQAPSLG